ncbi:hypothetical protein [Planotetraspora kaengkrachanensis]|uniref:DUF2530 domain-containing protein n=1 Tax=Planotetraspora kaengkrachanensis TaxID=575193 RepID=A0A8J3VBC9_9ACTN|nr:hypothetical protein [Planotetraspora kaengkrachanensis]GIG83504.1 hypothetical protein Pka01_66310 [Planotetraspora kaengkrachanensis]
MAGPTADPVRRLVIFQRVLAGVFLFWLFVSFAIVGSSMTEASWFMPTTAVLGILVGLGQWWGRSQINRALESTPVDRRDAAGDPPQG